MQADEAFADEGPPPDDEASVEGEASAEGEAWESGGNVVMAEGEDGDSPPGELSYSNQFQIG